MRDQIDYLYPLLSHPLQNRANELEIDIKITAHYLDFIKQDNKQVIRISIKHWTYINDILSAYDYYFNAVEPIKWKGYELIDYSLPKHHKVLGFDLMPVKFTSFAEPMVTNLQYENFANLHEGGVVFDLGAYSGLTSILFKEKVGESGKVIAVDADIYNIEIIKENLSLYNKLTSNEISLVHGAMWEHCDGIDFTSEGNMGAAVTSIIGAERGLKSYMKSYTLSKLAEDHNVKKVDFIKCDIEGAEAVVFNDADFFKKFRPRIIIEPHWVNGELTTKQCIEAISKYSYVCEEIEQIGVGIPLIACKPF